MECKPQEFTWTPESQVVLFSDGLVEATSTAGDQFGSEGLKAAVANTSPTTRFHSIETALAKHLGKEVATDDVSLMLINCP
jgi:serine phosphatase RsbU (regulator of sigma subunit)